MYRLIPVFFLVFIMYSCKDNDEFDSYTIGDDFIQSATNIALIDTFDVELSTFKLDSVVTSNTGTGLIGAYADPELGVVEAKTYSQFGFAFSGNSISRAYGINEKDKFDSITVSLRISDSGFLGDSLKLQTLKVYRLTEELQSYSNNNLYNNSSFEYEETEIGSIEFVPSQYSGKDLEIRLDDEVGLDIFNKLWNDTIYKDEPKKFDNNVKFLNYYPGLVISGTTQDGCVITTEISDSLLYMAMYTSRVDFDVINSVHKFPSINSQNQFNEIKSDRTNTDAALLADNGNDIVVANVTGDKTFIQAGIGYYTRVKIPGLAVMLELIQRRILLRADLVLMPVQNTYDEIDLPVLSIYESNRSNTFVRQLTNSEDEALVAYPNIDKYYNENTYYTFDLTSQISSDLADGFYDEDRGYIVGIDRGAIYDNLNRAVLYGGDNKMFKPMLKLYYVFY